jgi:hypothetical protein
VAVHCSGVMLTARSTADLLNDFLVTFPNIVQIPPADITA